MHPVSPELERWWPLARAVVRVQRHSRAMPLHVLFTEAVAVAHFHATYWPTLREGTDIVRRGLDSAAGAHAGKQLLHAGTGEEILSLVRAGQDAQARASYVVDRARRSPASRGHTILRELRSALAYLLDDGVEDRDDARLARLLAAHKAAPRTRDALAMALETFATFAAMHRPALDGLGGFSVEHIDEARAIAQALRERAHLRRQHLAVTREAIDLRDRVLVLLRQRVGAVRAAARFVFRDHPAIAQQATSAYERTRRAAGRRRAAASAPPVGSGAG